MSEKQQRLVFTILDFLNQSIQDGTVKQDDQEGLEVAMQCIGEAFGVDPSDEQQAARLSIKPVSLQTIFDVFLQTRSKVASGNDAGGSSSIPKPAMPNMPSQEEKSKAEKLKQAGNTNMSTKKYDEAIDAYSQAIELDPTNAVYYSNRAAAHSSKGDHLPAVDDAQKAIEVEPSFVKAYHRLGHAQYSLGDYTAAAAAFRRGLELEPSNANLKAGLQNAERLQAAGSTNDQESSTSVSTDRSATANPAPAAGGGLGNMADMLRNLGGGAGGGAAGMPDLAGIMNNPGMMQMAQNMMANGGLERLMSNPSVANMMNRMQSGGGIPSMEELMSDPTLRDMAGQFRGGSSSANYDGWPRSNNSG